MSDNDEIPAAMTDAQLAGHVRMLTRSDLDHEPTVCAARDRILKLSADLVAARAEVERLRGALQKIVNNWDNLHSKDRQQARAALAQRPDAAGAGEKPFPFDDSREAIYSRDDGDAPGDAKP